MTPHLPRLGAGGGAAHEFELLRGAARSHDIDLISSDLPEGPTTLDLGDSTIPAEGLCWHAAPPPRSSLDFARGIALSWPTVEARAQRDRVVSLSRAVARSLERRPADLVHLTFGEIAPVAGASSVPVKLLLFDVRSRQLRREMEVAQSRRARLAFGIEARKVGAWERRWFSRVEGLASVSSVDRGALEGALGREVSLIPNPIPQRFLVRPEIPRSPSTVTFVGNLSYWPNVDAVQWLAKEIWPIVRRERPDARLEIVGHGPLPAVTEAAALAGADLHADVADVRPFYWRAAVAVAPVRLGSGLRNKVLHAIACRAPVVATPAALEGIDARDGHHLWVGRSAPEFAAAILEVMNDPAEAQRRANVALALIEEHRAEKTAERFESWWRGPSG